MNGGFGTPPRGASCPCRALFFPSGRRGRRADEQGYELAGLDAARALAVRSAAEYLRDRPEMAWLGEFRVEVADGAGRRAFTFRAAGADKI